MQIKTTVTCNEESINNVAPRKMTEELIQQDISYKFAQKISHSLLEKGLLNKDEFRRLCTLNKESYSP